MACQTTGHGRNSHAYPGGRGVQTLEHTDTAETRVQVGLKAIGRLIGRSASRSGLNTTSVRVNTRGGSTASGRFRDLRVCLLRVGHGVYCLCVFSQVSRRYGALFGHSASQAGLATTHGSPNTAVPAVRCPSWAFGEPSWTCYAPLTTHHSSPGVTVSILGIRRAKLDVLHATDHPSQQGQDEMCCPVCCSLVTGCRLGQGWAFRCTGACFIMFQYDQLSQQEQADALLPAHVFPVTGFGTLPETGEKVLSTKLVAAKKEIHRVPAASAVVTSPAMSWPMLNGTLPATSLPTFRLSSAGLCVTTWSELVVWLQGAYCRWGQDQRLLMQADIASEIDDLTLQHQINVMEHKDFCRFISGETQVKTKHSLGQLFLWYAVYCSAAGNQGLLPVHSLRVADNERVESCPLTRGEWKKLITAALPNFRIIPTLGHVDPQQDESGSGAPAKLWKSMITSSQQQPAGTDEAARLQEAFDDVLHIPVSAIEVAPSSLKQLLSDHHVNSQTLRALDSCRQPQQLHAAVKLVWRKLPSATQAVVRADVREWVSMCGEAVPSTPSPADRFQFLQKCHAAINEAQAVSDWVTTALDLCTVLPRAGDPSPIPEVQSGRTFKAALIAISK